MFARQVCIFLTVITLLQLINFFIYTLIESKETYVDFVQMLRIENQFNDRCGKFKIDVNDIELTVLENRTMKPTVEYGHT